MKTQVLLVEDDAKLRRTLAAWISHAGYDVMQAPDGETAVRLLMIEHCSVVISDIVMGGINGLEVLKAASRLQVPPAVILLTGQGTLESAMAALRAGAFDYLLKPCNGDELLMRIAAAAAQVEANRQVYSALDALVSCTPGAGLPLSRPAALAGMPIAGAFSGLQPAASRTSGATAAMVLPARSSAYPPGDNLEQYLHLGDLEVGPSRLQVVFRSKPIALTRIEYMLLRYLAERPGRICRYSELAFASHRLPLDDGEARDLLRTHLQNLRSKICRTYFRVEAGAGCMLTVPAAGVTNRLAV
jgi:DNA-binding response OmpR family regulator